jgi:hypothetical protein
MEKNVNRPNKGMVQDNNPVDQPKETYRYALNAVNETNDGNRNLLNNEKSNEQCWELPLGFYPIGSCYTINNEILIFSVSGITSAIGIVKDCTYTEILNSECLGFSIEHQIDCTYRIKNGCERIFYFTDGLNPVRQVNIDTLDSYYSDAYIAWLANPIGPFVGEKYNCDLFALLSPYQIPCFADVQVLNGGQLLSGSYNFAIQYEDDNGNSTNWVTISRPVNIYLDSQYLPYLNIFGSSNLESDALGGTAVVTNKAIQLSISNLDTSFVVYRVACIRATSFTGLVTAAVVSPNIPITQNTFIYNGNPNGFTELEPNDITLGRLNLEYAEHIEQLENRLLVANTKGKQVNFCGFQKYASKIASHYIIKDVTDTNALDEGNPKNPLSPFECVGFMGGEVYAFGIVYVFKDGFESPAYHIPGPPVNKRWDWNTNNCVDIVTEYGVTPDNEYVFPWNQDIEHIVPLALAANYDLGLLPKVEKWRVYETAIDVNPGDSGQMAYWQCLNNYYPELESCDSGEYWGVDFCGDAIVNNPIRHHRFPSRTLEPHVDNDAGVETYYAIQVTIEIVTAWPVGVPDINLTTGYEVNLVPQTPIITNVEEADFISGVYTTNIVTINADSPTDISAILGSGDFFTTYAADFTVTYSVVFAYDVPYNGSTLKVLGVKFDNVEYPHPDIVGHYFVRAERDDFNRTILDSGIAGRMRGTATDAFSYITFSYFTRNNTGGGDYHYAFTPKFLYQRQNLRPEYTKVELEFLFDRKALSYIKEDGVGSFIVDTDTIIECRGQFYSGTDDTNGGTNHATYNIMTLNGASFEDTFAPGNRIYNTSLINNIQVLKTRQLPRNNNDIPYITYRVERDVHSNLDSISYYKMHNCVINSETVQPNIFAGDVYITQFKLTNTLYREFFNGIIGGILGVLAIAVAATLTILTFGATTPLLIGAIVLASIGITATAIGNTVNAMKETNLDQTVTDNELDGLVSSADSFTAYANEYLLGVYVESEINTALRQSTNNECGALFSEAIPAAEYFRSKIMYFSYDEEKWLPRGAPCPEPYHYNVDFSRMAKEKIYFPLVSNYNCCSECLESFPSRVYYSEQSFSEENGDNFRVILPNNYRDIEAQHGGITDLLRKNNNLLIFTEECLWNLPQNVQQQTVNEIVTFLGTGSYFSIPPRKLVDSDMGSAGTRHKWSVTKSPLGVVYVSEIEKAVYLIGGQEGIQNISNQGMYNWFTENTLSYLATQFFNLTDEVFPNLNNPNNPNGIGIHGIYDPRHQRIILTKRDYLINPNYVDTFQTISIEAGYLGLVSGKLYFDIDDNRFVRYNGGLSFTTVSFTNDIFFEDKSYTISFSLLSNSWVSFHSYLPLFYYSDHYTFYSSISNSIYKHNIIGSHQKYYDVLYSHIIETVSVSNPMTTRLWSDILLETYARTWNVVTQDYYDIRNVTFNYLTLYNSRQVSGELNMVVKDTQANPQDYYEQQTTNSNTSIVIDRKERDWHINDFRDMRINYLISMFTKAWTSIASQYPIDKVVNPPVININKDWYQQESFRDKYLIIRLRFTNFEDVELTTNFVIETEQQSFR